MKLGHNIWRGSCRDTRCGDTRISLDGLRQERNEVGKEVLRLCRRNADWVGGNEKVVWGRLFMSSTVCEVSNGGALLF